MIRRVCWLAVVALTYCCPGADTECKPLAPCYTVQGITNIASGTPGTLAPNTLASIYGTNLSFVTRAISADDIQAGELPIRLPGTGVQVWLDELPGHLYLVSPEQVNFLVPSNLRATEVTIRVFRDSTVGPAVRLKLREAAPALFQLDAGHVLASKLDYSLVTATAPSHPDEWVILWATGLGSVTPPTTYGTLPPRGRESREDRRLPGSSGRRGGGTGTGGVRRPGAWVCRPLPDQPEASRQRPRQSGDPDCDWRGHQPPQLAPLCQPAGPLANSPATGHRPHALLEMWTTMGP